MSWLTMVLLASVVLILLALGMAPACGGETTRTSGPCRNIAPGPFSKCRYHRGQKGTRADVVGFLVLLVGLALLLLVWLPNDGFQQLFHDIDRW